MNPITRVILALAGAAAACTFWSQCASGNASGGGTGAASGDGLRAWDTVYDVLQHPRCRNCHPAGDRPLVGEHGEVHPQNVQRGERGLGRFAMACATCHREVNTPGAHMPPGAPHWNLPRPDMPLVFEGRSKAQLARQLVDRAHNGGRSPADLLRHVSEDALVLWGWQPGDGRASVPVPHEEFVRAFRTWVDAGCPIPQ